MRKALLIAAVVVVACAKKEPPPADTATPAPPPPPPPPPALTAADVKGNWTGTSKRQGDTTTVAFMLASTSDSTGKFTWAKGKQTVDYAIKLDADSMVATSKAYTDPNAPKGSPKVTFHSIGHMKDGKLAGVFHIFLAAKPDSMVAQGNWEASKAP